MKRIVKIFYGNSHQSYIGEKTKLIHFKAVGLHLMWLTRTNLENNGSFQEKKDTFFLV